MRKNSLNYKLPSQQGAKIDVCKTMFLRTLGLKTDVMVTQLLKAKRRRYEDNIAPINDRRGKHEVYENHKADHKAIRYHINSYKPSISHDTRVNAPNRRYLNPEITVTDMLVDYSSSSSKKVSYSAYYTVFKSENIGFSRPSVDDCEVCLQFNDHKATNEENHNSDTCDICKQFKIHKDKYTKARIGYNKPVNGDTVCFTADMQKVVVLPKLTTKEHVFTSRLVTFNETFAAKSSGYQDYCVLWHEAISGRKAADVASSYIMLITASGIPINIMTWAD